MSTSEKNGSSFSRDKEEELDLSTRPEKTAKLQRRQWNFLLLYYSNILKELDEDQLVLSKAKLRFCLHIIQQEIVRFPRSSRRYLVRNKFSDRMIKQLLKVLGSRKIS